MMNRKKARSKKKEKYNLLQHPEWSLNKMESLANIMDTCSSIENMKKTHKATLANRRTWYDHGCHEKYTTAMVANTMAHHHLNHTCFD